MSPDRDADGGPGARAGARHRAVPRRVAAAGDLHADRRRRPAGGRAGRPPLVVVLQRDPAVENPALGRPPPDRHRGAAAALRDHAGRRPPRHPAGRRPRAPARTPGPVQLPRRRASSASPSRRTAARRSTPASTSSASARWRRCGCWNRRRAALAATVAVDRQPRPARRPRRRPDRPTPARKAGSAGHDPAAAAAGPRPVAPRLPAAGAPALAPTSAPAPARRWKAGSASSCCASSSSRSRRSSARTTNRPGIRGPQARARRAPACPRKWTARPGANCAGWSACRRARPESGMIRTYLEWLSELPWKLRTRRSRSTSAHAREILEAETLRAREDQAPHPGIPRGPQAQPGGQEPDPVLRRPARRRQDLARPVHRPRHRPAVRARQPRRRA